MYVDVSNVQWTIQTLFEWVHQKFRSLHFSTPRLDAELILSYGLNLPRISIYTNYLRPLNDQELDTLRALVKRRMSNEPIAYIIGKKEFYSLPFFVSNDVLIPRPETELLVETVLSFLKNQSISSPSILDMGTGSGAIALSLKHALPVALVFAVDKSKKALQVAQKNAKILGVEVTFLESDLFSQVTTKFDCIVSNPPYIPSSQIAHLPPDVLKEPLCALDGGSDGLTIIRQLIARGKDFLNTKGLMAIECGQGQAATIEKLFTQEGYQSIQTFNDLAQIPRVVVANWNK